MFGNAGLLIAQVQLKRPGCTAQTIPSSAGDPSHATCQAYHRHGASLSTGAFILGQETPSRNRATAAYPSSLLGFLLSNALGFFAANHDPACNELHAFSSLLLGRVPAGQPAEARPAAPACFDREPRLRRCAACPKDLSI